MSRNCIESCDCDGLAPPTDRSRAQFLCEAMLQPVPQGIQRIIFKPGGYKAGVVGVADPELQRAREQQEAFAPAQ